MTGISARLVDLGSLGHQETPNLHTYIDQNFFGKSDSVESSSQSKMQVALKTLTVIGAGFSRIPFIPLNKDVLGSSKAAAKFLATANGTAFGVVYTRFGWKILGEIFSPPALDLTDRTEIIDRCSKVLNHKAFKITTAAIVALCSQIPAVYLAYKNNSQGLLMSAIIIGVDTWMPMYSVVSAINGAAQRRRLRQLPTLLKDIKNCMLQQFESYKGQLGDEAFAAAALIRWNEIKQEADCKLRVNKVIGEVLNFAPDKPSPQLLEKLALGFGGNTYLTTLIYFGSLGYNGAKELVDSSAFGALGSTLSAASNAYVLQSIIHTPRRMVKLGYDLHNREYVPTLNESISPWKTYISKSILLLAALFSFGPTVTASKEAYDEINSGWSYYMQTVVSMAVILFLMDGCNDSVEEALTEYHVHNGTDKEQALAMLSQDLTMLSSVIARTPDTDFAEFLLAMDDEDLKPIANKVQRNADQIRLNLHLMLDDITSDV